MTTFKATILFCAPFAALSTACLGAAIDDARQYAARAAQMRCEVVTMQLQALGAGADAAAHKQLAGHLAQRLAQFENELAPVRERVYAQREALDAAQMEELRLESAATIKECTSAASAAYQARVEEGSAEPPTPRPTAVAPFMPSAREKSLAVEARGAIQGQAPQ